MFTFRLQLTAFTENDPLMHSLIELIYKGALLGMITALSFGPIFFSIIETSISRGHRLAICIAVGVLISDALLIAVSFLSIGTLLHGDALSSYVGLAGGLIKAFMDGGQTHNPVLHAFQKPLRLRGFGLPHLHIHNRRDHLQIVLHAVMHLAQQHLFLM